MSRTKVIVLSIIVGLVIVAIAVQLIISAGYKRKSREELALLVAEGGSRNILDLVPKPLGRLAGKPVKLLYAGDFRVTMWEADIQYKKVDYDDTEVADADKAYRAFCEFSHWVPASSIIWDAVTAEAKPFNEDWLQWLERLTSDSGPLLDRIRTTVSNGNAMFDVDWTQGRSPMLPHLTRVHESVRLLRVDAYLRLRKGDTAGAIADVHTMLHMRDTLDHDPVFMSKSEAFSLDRMSLGTLAMVVEGGRPDRESIEGMLEELEGREARNRMTGVLLGETAMGLNTIDMIAKDPEDTYQQMYMDAPGTSNTTHGKIIKLARNFSFRATWMRDADEYNLLREMRVLREWSRKPLVEGLKMPPYASRAGNSREGVRRFTDYAVGGLDGIFNEEARADLNIAKTRLLLGVYLYKLDNGTYPESAEALVPRYLPQVPADPFDNRPLLYTRTGDGYTIESAREKELVKAGDAQK